MKKLFIFLTILIAMTSCNVLKCTSYGNGINYNEDRTKITTCIECETNNKEIKGAIVRLFRNLNK